MLKETDTILQRITETKRRLKTMRLNERNVRDMLKNAHKVFNEYKDVGFSADGPNEYPLEFFASQERLVDELEDFYSQAQVNIRIIRNDPSRYGFNRGELEAMVLEIDRGKQLIDEEREIYEKKEIEYLGPM